MLDSIYAEDQVIDEAATQVPGHTDQVSCILKL